MNGARLKGKRVKQVYQSYIPTDAARAGMWVLNAIEFTDGSVLRFIAVETEFEPRVEGVYPGRAIDANDSVRREG